MAKLSPEHTVYAVTVLEKLFKQRELSQKWLEDHSGISQPEISRILSRQKDPTKKELQSLFEALGLTLSEIISTLETLPDDLLVYVATPLTGFVKDKTKDSALREFVTRITTVADKQHFDKPNFRFYWPGNHTHPVDHAHVAAKQVYITDRSRASSYQLLVMLCAVPSFGMGQENEIATQAGVPAIRLVPEGISRMMSGSFLQSWDITYMGSIENGIKFDEAAFVIGLGEIRKLYFIHQALFGGIAPSGFGERMQRLVDDRVGNRTRFAEQVGIGPNYLEAMFTEPLAVCNPSAMLLLMMAKVLNVSVAHLLWETGVDDATFASSMASWKAWVSETDGLDARTALAIRENWAEEYQLHRYANATSNRNVRVFMKSDWNWLYLKCHAKRADSNQIKKEISRYIFKEGRISVASTQHTERVTDPSIERTGRKIAKKAGMF